VCVAFSYCIYYLYTYSIILLYGFYLNDHIKRQHKWFTFEWFKFQSQLVQILYYSIASYIITRIVNFSLNINQLVLHLIDDVVISVKFSSVVLLYHTIEHLNHNNHLAVHRCIEHCLYTLIMVLLYNITIIYYELNTDIIKRIGVGTSYISSAWY